VTALLPRARTCRLQTAIEPSFCADVIVCPGRRSKVSLLIFSTHSAKAPHDQGHASERDNGWCLCLGHKDIGFEFGFGLGSVGFLGAECITELNRTKLNRAELN